jgi:hypothetical protein
MYKKKFNAGNTMKCIIFNDETDIDDIWIYYLSFCNIYEKQYYKTRNKLKDIIQSIISNNEFISGSAQPRGLYFNI